jgi:hypothetical protein
VSSALPPKPEVPRGIEPQQHRNRDSWVWRYRLRWRAPATSRRLVEEFATVEDALDFRAHLRLAARGSVLDELGRGRMLLRDFVENEWWPKDAGRRLERNTLETYAPVWNVHIGPRLGHLQVRQLKAPAVQALKKRMESDGVGAPTTRRALAIPQATCRYAIAQGERSSSPVREVRKPAVRRKLEIVAISPTQVESLRRALSNDPAGQLLVTLIAYQGLRPEEALALTETQRREEHAADRAKERRQPDRPRSKRRPAGNGRDSRSPELFGQVCGYRAVPAGGPRRGAARSQAALSACRWSPLARL